MYDFVRGPMVWMSAVICLAGLIYRTVSLFRLTRRKEWPVLGLQDEKSVRMRATSADERKLDAVAGLRNSVLGKHPVMAVASTLFHAALVLSAVFLMAHNLLLRQAFGIRLPSLPDGLADFLTAVVLAGGIFFLVRRLAVPKVAAISSGIDYGVLLLTVVPYLTGFLAHHQLGDYKTVIMVHMLSGNIMLIALPFTKIGHMVFFFFSRIALAGEYCLGRGSRTWAT
jgi:nitrate reductase gamma subunit